MHVSWHFVCKRWQLLASAWGAGSASFLARCSLPLQHIVETMGGEQAHWLTGQLLYVGGGWRMHQ